MLKSFTKAAKILKLMAEYLIPI